ncbi:MAG TPA: hypothetical protein VJ572_01820 [Azonexus sp.]|nr:hypothetical protein [Azonexus sp.]
MSKANDIMRAAEAALIASGVAGDRVTRSLEKGYSYDDFPAILLHQVGDVPAGTPAPVGYEYRQLTVELEIRAEGDVPHDACDAAHGPANAVMFTLGVGVASGSVQWTYDEENPALGVCLAQYIIPYRRREGEL